MDLLAQLAGALAGRYDIERELGGGGMSRVFVARETALGRTVVIKVLAPELAAELSGDRFSREVKLAAQLQDPHIVPVFAAGEAVGLPYYTMPYVAGDSLRDRLRRGPRLSLNESIEILRGVLLALAAAHESGVVHRDIKPENILLTRAGTAVVTDFGIAKALAASRTHAEELHGATSDALTQHGVSLGTPAYMAPEQAAGGAVDHRADLYAWGLVAYEMLAGAHPYAEKSNAQQLIAAQLMEPVAPLVVRAAQVPNALAKLIEQALAKPPEDRPSSAREIIRLMDATSGRAAPAVDSQSASARRRRRILSGVVVVLAVGVAGAVLVTSRSRSAQAAQNSAARVMVMPFDNRTGESSLAPLGDMAADWITRGISETGLVDVAPVPQGTQGESTRLSAARGAGAGTLLAGTIYRTGDSVQIIATITDVNAGKVTRSLEPVTASVANPLAGLETLRRRVAGALAERVDPAFDTERLQGTPPSFEAYRAMLDARASETMRASQKAADLFRHAAALDTGYMAPALEELAVQLNLRMYPRADSLIAWLRARRARLTPYESVRLDAYVARREGGFGRGMEAVRRLAALAPRSAQTQAALARMAMAVNRAFEADSIYRRIDTARIARNGSTFWVDRAYAAHLLGDDARALALYTAAERVAPNEGFALGWRVRHLALTGRVAETRALVDSIARGPRLSAELDIFAAAVVGSLIQGDSGAARQFAETLIERRRGRPFAPYDGPASEGLYIISAMDVAGHHAEAVHLVDSLIAAQAQSPRLKLVKGTQVDVTIWPLALRGGMLARAGDTAGADRVDRQLEDLRASGPALASAAVGRAVIAAQLGRREAAVARLREAIEGGATFAFTNPGALIVINAGVAVDSPWFKPLRGYAPFEELMKPVR